MHCKNASSMVSAAEENTGIDVLIISTSSPSQAEFWEKRLPSLVKPDAVIVGVTEDWPQGAGNGLGTLYAFKQAREKILKIRNLDLFQMLKNGKSVAIYHTAGEGKRLAPLVLSEGNNKSAVKLPGRRLLGDSKELLTILEAVIKQTSLYSSLLRGRVSVFWADQLFIPSLSLSQTTLNAPIALFTKLLHPLEWDQNTWDRMHLKDYGITVFDSQKTPLLLEKLTYQEISFLQRIKRIDTAKEIGISMGSFSLSGEMAMALLKEFEPELLKKRGKMDTDPDFWMPLTLDRNLYCSSMMIKGVSLEDSALHYRRMQQFKHQFEKEHSSQNSFFQTIDIGAEAYWWDFGTVLHYYQNNLKLLDATPEGEAMRILYLIDPSMITPDGSCLIDCNIPIFVGSHNVLAGVNAKRVDAENCLIIHTEASEIAGNSGLAYQVCEDKPLFIERDSIRSDVFLNKNSKTALQSTLHRDGKADWQEQLAPNAFSYEKISQIEKEIGS